MLGRQGQDGARLAGWAFRTVPLLRVYVSPGGQLLRRFAFSGSSLAANGSRPAAARSMLRAIVGSSLGRM